MNSYSLLFAFSFVTKTEILFFSTCAIQLLSVLLASEEEIKTRSKAVESHWSPDKYQDKSSGEKAIYRMFLDF